MLLVFHTFPNVYIPFLCETVHPPLPVDQDPTDMPFEEPTEEPTVEPTVEPTEEPTEESTIGSGCDCPTRCAGKEAEQWWIGRRKVL